VRATPIVPVALVVGALLGWGSGTGLARRADPPAAEAPPGKALFAQYCAACHGAEGRGDGPSAASLPIKPWNLTEARVLGHLPDEFIRLTITKGGQAVGLSPLMPAWEAYLGQEQVADLVAYIRSLAVPRQEPSEVFLGPIDPPGAPVQPILFSHLIHAGAFQINCQYCHADARRSQYAGLPSVERCMGCHKIVAAAGNPEVQKLQGYWQRREPIPWVRIYKVPEFVYFQHRGHIRAGLACQTCHGQIQQLMRIPAIEGPNRLNDLLNLVGLTPAPPPLSMGWCVECHRATNRAHGIDAPSVSAGTAAPLDCVTCHH
jgi:mono/diheme cytochrome c family protein